jgi:hypothetical protein
MYETNKPLEEPRLRRKGDIKAVRKEIGYGDGPGLRPVTGCRE